MNLKSLFPTIESRSDEGTLDSGDAREFDSFDAAVSASAGEGYTGGLIPEVVLQKTFIYREQLLAVPYPTLTANQARQILAVSLSTKGNELSVLDLGGGCGVHFLLAKKIFGNQFRFRWSVVETHAMVERARVFESDELSFYSNIGDATENRETYDLAFSSGALQYMPDALEMLGTLIEAKAENLFLTRIALSQNDRNQIFIHESALNKHGRGKPLETASDVRTYCPVTMVGKAAIERLLATNYDIITAFSESIGAYKFGRQSFNQYGYFCRFRK